VKKFIITTVFAFVSVCLAPRVIAQGVVYDTTPYWAAVSATIGGLGPGQTTTMGETFVAPAGQNVTLNNFSFYAESYYPNNGGVANLQLQDFVFAWSGSMTGNGGRAVGNPVYLSPTFQFSPPPGPGGWVPLTAAIGGGLTLVAGDDYVMGFTLSDPADYAASSGDIEFQEVSARNAFEPPLPSGVGGDGGAVWFNNGNNFAALNTATWDTWGDTGDMSFTANFTVVPEPSAFVLVFILGSIICISRSLTRKRREKTS